LHSATVGWCRRFQKRGGGQRERPSTWNTQSCAIHDATRVESKRALILARASHNDGVERHEFRHIHDGSQNILVRLKERWRSNNVEKDYRSGTGAKTDRGERKKSAIKKGAQGRMKRCRMRNVRFLHQLAASTAMKRKKKLNTAGKARSFRQ